MTREVDALQRVDHHAVVKALEVGEERDHLYAAYELIDGEDVQKALRAAVPPSPEDCWAFLRGMSEGLDAVHAVDFVHRDLKPSNIVLRSNEWSAPVIVDFGYARRFAASKLTATGFAVGTWGYLAPEVSANPDTCSPLSDQWSLARVVLEVLTVSLGMDLADFASHEEMLTASEDIAPQSCSVLRRSMGVPTGRYPSLTDFATDFRSGLIEDGLAAATSKVLGDAPAWRRTESLVEYFERLGCEIIADKRPVGCLWVSGDRSLLERVSERLRDRDVFLRFAARGGKATRHVPAWYTEEEG